VNRLSACFWFTVLALLLVGGIMYFKWTAPYGPGYLPQWVEKGKAVVDAIEAYKKEHGTYPEGLPTEIDIREIPGCKSVTYSKRLAKDGKEFYVIKMFIHINELVMYDSRGNLEQITGWGPCEILDGWMWTKD